MKPSAVMAAVIAMLAGAWCWAEITILTNYEIGWAAWGIGALVGFAAVYFGGRGQPLAVLCAALTLVSIFGGKLMATHHIFQKVFSESLEENLTVERYNETKEDARLFALLKDENEWPAFMVERDYSEAESGVKVSQEELDNFRQLSAPMLRELQANQPSFESWRAAFLEKLGAEIHQTSIFSGAIFSMMLHTLGLVDIIFALLGIVTALKIVSRADQPAA